MGNLDMVGSVSSPTRAIRADVDRDETLLGALSRPYEPDWLVRMLPEVQRRVALDASRARGGEHR